MNEELSLYDVLSDEFTNLTFNNGDEEKINELRSVEEEFILNLEGFPESIDEIPVEELSDEELGDYYWGHSEDDDDSVGDDEEEPEEQEEKEDEEEEHEYLLYH